MNSTALELAVKPHEDQLPAISERIQNLKITDDASLAYVAESRTLVVKLDKAAEAARKVLVEPLNAQVKTINARFKTISDKTESWLTSIDTTVRQYRREMEVKAEEERKRIIREQIRLEDERLAKIKEAEEKMKVETGLDVDLGGVVPMPPPPPAPVVQEAPKSVQTASGGFGTAKRWTWEVTDLALVPHEYMDIDRGKVTEAVRKGERVIPGIRIYQKESLTDL